MTAPEREHWDVPVLTAVLLKPATLVVAVAETRVVLIPPPGEGFIVPDDSLPILLDAVRAAHSVADRRLRGYRGGERS